MAKNTRVGTTISVGHNSPEGVPHGHSYEVWAKFVAGFDARDLLDRLTSVTKPLDHTFLPDTLRFGEDLAEYIGLQLDGCVEVEVRRPLERIEATWTP